MRGARGAGALRGLAYAGLVLAAPLLLLAGARCAAAEEEAAVKVLEVILQVRIPGESLPGDRPRAGPGQGGPDLLPNPTLHPLPTPPTPRAPPPGPAPVRSPPG